ncbi:MAG: bifunctional aminoglycoside phosphotransferase/ATP-binding protein [Beijerinckiaceae bacterium]
MELQSCCDQSNVFAFLSDPATHGLHEPVARIDTHGAAVFLAGKDVYKIKRAVRFPFMDYSTLDKRRWACERELAVNKDNAPEIYLGTVPISQDGSRLSFGDAGKVVEWAVHMRRFDENRTLDRLAGQNKLDLQIVAKLADVVVASHRHAPVAAGTDAGKALERLMEETLAALEAAPEIFANQAVASLRHAMRQALVNLVPLLSERENQGQVRRCHGDLHLRNIALIDDRPVLFDAIEFDETIATCDVLYDLAFLLMDLWTRGLHRHANLLFNRYLWACDDVKCQLKGLSVLPLFLSLRAAIRAKVSILQPGNEVHTREARRYLEAASSFLAPCRLDLIAIGGLSGSGKSSLAAALAGAIGRAPGTLHLRSDIERKRLLNVREFDRLPGDAYRPEITTRTYERLRDLASSALEAGHSVVIDAVHLRLDERLAVERIARRHKAHFIGLWLEAPINMLQKRVGRRKMDASDATADIVLAQAKQPTGAVDWLRLDASTPVEIIVKDALTTILR